MWKWFIDGMILLFPVVLVSVVFFYLVELFASPLDMWIESAFPSLPGAPLTSKIIAVAITMMIVLIVGYLGSRWILSRFMKHVNKLFLKIPIIRKIFHSSHEVVNTLLREEDRGFQNVVLFPFGDTNGYAVSFLPRKDGTFEKDHTAVLLPGTPNPLQGFILYVETDKMAYSELPLGQAMKWNISIGSAEI